MINNIKVEETPISRDGIMSGYVKQVKEQIAKLDEEKDKKDKAEEDIGEER